MRRAVVVVAVLLSWALIGLEATGAPPAARFAVALLLGAALVAAGARFRRPGVWTVVLGLGVLAPVLYVLDPAPGLAYGFVYVGDIPGFRLATELGGDALTVTDGWIWVEPRWREVSGGG